MHRRYRPIGPQKYIGYRLTLGKARSTYAPVVLTNYRIENSNGCPGNVMHSTNSEEHYVSNRKQLVFW